MALTPDSSSSSYITPDEFLTRYDSRLVSQYVSDTGSPVTVGIQSNANLLTVLADASGLFETAATVGGRYRPADLQAMLATSSGTYLFIGANIIKRIISDLAMGMLRERRGMVEDQPMPQYINALNQLELLRSGETILPFRETEQAGQTSDSYMSEFDFQRQGRISTVYGRLFGSESETQGGNNAGF